MFPTRRIVVLCLSFSLCLLLAACGNKGPLTPAPAPQPVPPASAQ